MAFYQKGLGWRTNGIIGTEYDKGAVVLFELNNGVVLCLFERKNLAWDAQVPLGTSDVAAFSMGYFVNSDEEVDAVMEQAKKAGAKIAKPAQAAFWGGYHGYFQDLDGHLWEIGHNPSWKVRE